MKRILTVLSTIALASTLAIPMFAKAKSSKQAPKAQETTSTTAKAHKHHRQRSHSKKNSAKVNAGSTTGSTPQK